MRSPHRRRRFAAMAGVAAALTLLGTAVTGAAVAMTGAGNDTGGAPGKAVLTGVPGMAVDDATAAGAVELRTNNGNRQLLTAPQPIAGARFGDVIHDTEIGKLYFNLERYALIGAPGLTVDGESNAGGIYVYKRDQDDVEFVTVLTQADPAIPGEAQAGAEFGSSIDSYVQPDQSSPIAGSTHVYVGVPGLNVGDVEAAGGVVQIDLTRTSDQPSAGVEVQSAELHTMLTSDASEYPEAGDRLGDTVLVDGGDFFAGAPAATVGEYRNAGFVLLVRPDERVDQLLHPGALGMPGSPYPGARFGAALDKTTEKLPADLGRARGLLAIGAPGYQVHYQNGAGKVYVLGKPPGSGRWVFERGFSQDSTNDGTGLPVGGHAEPGDRFGESVLFASRQSKYGLPYLLVGVPGEDVGNVEDAGLVTGLFGLPSQHEGHTSGVVMGEREFGATLATNTRFHNYWPLDIEYEYLIGIPGADGGAGSVAYGVGSNNGEIRWHQQWMLYTGESQPGDGYGAAFDQGDSSS